MYFYMIKTKKNIDDLSFSSINSSYFSYSSWKKLHRFNGYGVNSTACPRNSHGVAHKRSLPQSITPIPDLRSNLSVSAPGFTGIRCCLTTSFHNTTEFFVNFFSILLSISSSTLIFFLYSSFIIILFLLFYCCYCRWYQLDAN